MTEACTRDVAFETLVDYLAGELPDEDADSLDEHLFLCGECTRSLDAICGMQSELARSVESGVLFFPLTDALSRDLEAAGAKTREFVLKPGGSARCGVAPEDDLVILRLPADLDGVTHASVTLTDDDGLLDILHEDVPIEPGAATIRVAYGGAILRPLPDLRVRIRLRAEVSGGDARTTDYELLHSRAGPPADG